MLSADSVNSWLDNVKLTVAAIDTDVDQYISGRVLGRLAQNFDTTTWVDEATSPALVVQVMAMLYAAAEYRKRYSEDLEGGAGLNWAEWLEMSAEKTLDDILSGAIQISSIEALDTGLMSPIFYPNDASSIDDPAKFSMGQVF